MASARLGEHSRLDRFLRGPAVVLLALVLFTLVNHLSARHYTRWDWTQARHFTLSSRSRQVVRSLREPVDVYVLLGRQDALFGDTAELAERFASEGPRFRLHYLDPDRQRERLFALAQELGLQLIADRSSDQVFSRAAVVLRRGRRHWEVSREALRELGRDPSGDDEAARLLNARITVERALTEGLLQVDREGATKLCFSQGHLEMPLSGGDRAGQGFAEDLRHSNFEVREVEVHGVTGVPANCAALVIAGSQRTWTPEDASAVERYVRAGGNVGIFVDLVVLEGRIVPTGLEGVARLVGIELPAALTVEADRRHLLGDAPPVRFQADTWNDHELTRDLRGRTVFASMVRPLRRMERAAAVPQALLSSTPEAWGETSIQELLRTFTPVKDPADVAGPIHLAMAGEDPEVRRRDGVAAGRVVVVGTSEVVSGDYFSPQGRAMVANADFSEAIVGWLTARRELVNIPSRPVSRAALLVNEQDLLQLAVYLLGLIPLAAALVGWAVWRARKQAP
ncbi:MAG: GldG family protein [Deltaproteobacteria bacterium]|nr:GldG family protein [Deltaproteobacteria bacterium]